MITIPRFKSYELKDLVQLLGEEGIDFDYEDQATRVSGYGSDIEYLLLVSEDDYEKALQILMEYFDISAAVPEPFTGDCPACESHISKAYVCPECGLALAIGTPPIFQDHPFYKFLESNGLLPKKTQNRVPVTDC